MSASNDYMQQLLGGLLQYQPPQVDSGLLGQMTAPYGGTQNLAMSLLANSGSGQRFPAILGKSLQDSQQLQTQQAMQRLQMAQGAESLGLNIQKNQALSGLFGGPASPTQTSAAVPQLPAGGPQGSAQTAQQPQQFAASQQSAPDDYTQMPINGIPAEVYKRGLVIGQGMKASEAEESVRKLQLESYKQVVLPKLFHLDTLMKSDQPLKYIGADPALAAAVQQQAQRMGMTKLDDANARTVLASMRNQIAAKAQLPEEAPAVQMKTTPIGLGGSIQTDPISGKISGGAPQQETAQFQLPDGSVRMMTKQQGMAQGLTPFNPATFINQGAADSQAQAIANYKMPPLTGFALKSAQGQETMRQVLAMNPQYDASQYGTKTKARTAFATGKQGDIVRSLSVATDHLDQLSTAAEALKNKDYPAINKLVNMFSTQTGNPAVTNFDAMKEIVGDEVVKAVVGATGASADREAIKKSFTAANSPAQLAGVIQKYKGLMGGQLTGLRRQYEKSTGLTDFNEMVSPTAQAELAAPTAAPVTKSIGGKTYVQQNGKWYAQ